MSEGKLLCSTVFSKRLHHFYGAVCIILYTFFSCWQRLWLWPRIRGSHGKIEAITCPKLVRLSVMYFRRCLALSGAPIYFELNCKKCLSWIGCPGLHAERVNDVSCPSFKEKCTGHCNWTQNIGTCQSMPFSKHRTHLWNRCKQKDMIFKTPTQPSTQHTLKKKKNYI